MDLDKFHAAVNRIRAEQYFEEKAASAQPVSAVALAGLARAASASDPELLKLAAVYCPEAPLEFYERRLGGTFITKEAVSPKWIASRVTSGIAKASPERGKDFVAHMKSLTDLPSQSGGLSGKNWLDADQAAQVGETALHRLGKTAEPGPPPGVPLDEWDKILQGKRQAAK